MNAERDPADLATDAIIALTEHAIDAATEHHHRHNDPLIALPETLIHEAMHALIDVQIRHPEWAGRLARIRFFALDGHIADSNALDAIVREHPLGSHLQRTPPLGDQ